MVMQNLHDVLVDSLKDLYHAEKQLVRALPKMAKSASTGELREAIEEHLQVTQGHVGRLEDIFQELDIPARAKVCHGMMGIIEEGKEVLDHRKGGDPCATDAALIAAAQKVEHYEIAAYGSARTFAQRLGLDHVAEMLEQTLNEEKDADQKLTAVAEGGVNQAAAEESGHESEMAHAESDEEEGEEVMPAKDQEEDTTVARSSSRRSRRQ